LGQEKTGQKKTTIETGGKTREKDQFVKKREFVRMRGENVCEKRKGRFWGKKKGVWKHREMRDGAEGY